MKFQIFYLLLISQFISFGQFSAKEIEKGYKFYNSHNGIFQKKTKFTVNPNQIENVCYYINLDSILANFKSFSPDNFDKLDIVFSEDQVNTLNRKLQQIVKVELDPEKLDSRYIIGEFAVTNESFPVFQKSIDGVEYAFIYQSNLTVPEYSRLLIYEERDEDWAVLGFGQLPLFGKERMRERIQKFPEEYQVINSILLGTRDLIQLEFVEIDRISNGYSAESFQIPDNIKNKLDKDDLSKMMNFLNNAETGKMDITRLLDGLKVFPESEIKNCGKTIIRLSKPYLFEVEGEKYALIYSSIISSPLNAGASIKLLKKSNGLYELIASPMLWVS